MEPISLPLGIIILAGVLVTGGLSLANHIVEKSHRRELAMQSKFKEVLGWRDFSKNQIGEIIMAYKVAKDLTSSVKL